MTDRAILLMFVRYLMCYNGFVSAVLLLGDVHVNPGPKRSRSRVSTSRDSRRNKEARQNNELQEMQMSRVVADTNLEQELPSSGRRLPLETVKIFEYPFYYL